MNQQGVRWTADQVLALAPDAASRRAGSKLGAAGPWSEAGCAPEGTVWGLCRGSGRNPYRTVADLTDPSGGAFRCTCPSRKFPCKHALGLLLLWAADDPVVAGTAPADWAQEWLDSRAQRAERRQEKEAAAQEGHPVEPEGATADTDAARQRAARRAARITAGTTELEQRLTDLVRSGLAGAQHSGGTHWEETAARMVDAQAPGLAARSRELGTLPATGDGWPARLLEECALTHLLGRAWNRREELPEGLAATVRTRVGLPSSADGPALRDNWLVLSRRDTADGHLVTRRTWLHGERTGRTTLLLSFGAAGRAPALALPHGLALDAELRTHSGTGELRADLGEQFTAPAPSSVRPAGGTTGEALSRYGAALAEDPWQESWPVTLAEVTPRPAARRSGHWQLADAEGALPLTTQAAAAPGLWRLVALSGGRPVSVFGECGHRGFTPLAAWAGTTGELVSLC